MRSPRIAPAELRGWVRLSSGSAQGQRPSPSICLCVSSFSLSAFGPNLSSPRAPSPYAHSLP